MKRAVSYSDSFIILGKHGLVDLAPFLIPSDQLETIPPSISEVASASIQQTPQIPQIQAIQEEEEPRQQPRSRAVLCFLFTFKGSFHLLLISAFETLFYFLYVNKSENQGILTTINTYYQPIVKNCQQNWSNTTKWLVGEFLAHDVNVSQIDASGLEGATQRTAYNQHLLIVSAMYSVICFTICILATAFVRWKKWDIPWKRMLVENLLFVLVLGLYEVFFFRTIIYTYDTISTSELNMYIIDGLEQCVLLP
jgi:hypothetical protein